MQNIVASQVSLKSLMQFVGARSIHEVVNHVVNKTDKQDILLTGIAIDSRQVKAGELFCAISGTNVNGAQFVQDAINNGAAAILLNHADVADIFEKRLIDSVNAQCDFYVVDNVAKVIGRLASAFYANPSHQMQLTGITGTNGKTTVAYLLAQAMHKLGNKSAYLGTIGNGFVDRLEASNMTTSDAVTIQKWLAIFHNDNAKHVAMEVSSHALAQYRVDGCQFNVAVWTNLSQDHLDYHGSMQAYSAAKMRLFNEFSLACAVVNIDDAFARDNLLNCSAETIITYGSHNNADLRLLEYDFVNKRSVLKVVWQNQQYELQSTLVGRFNAQNILAVVAVLLAYGHSLDEIASVLTVLNAPDGRMQWFGQGQQPLVVVDYAHTPDALAQVLMTLREICQGKLIVCFGCGGDRDRSKRAKMGRVAEQYADKVCLTDDNPRSEDAEQIVKDILKGMQQQAQVIHNRAQAIASCISQASANDVVLIAGKGHEQYQIVGNEKFDFDDSEQVKLALEAAA